ncbi:penicillin-binding transpeptidase domain-containing protein [Saccharopolyspora sp. TS4A08]|uniref:Penicillin-binding transpeptidase domain-containing protein n=1 Tax=Saccharopolyspora ipomoeae TaxID=3042027 RepID=A0ABT6PLX1_9PSEU|nr:penicillin-binding transpeptidase domain-containing protein [Saccharopolyspora sp. TS4A08]MDI2028481.1 penicillin-binding transpeptidase domain-containing protein [Saccharopolyspora sp. TS4A08]
MLASRIMVGLTALLLVPVAGCSTGPSEKDVATSFVNAVAAGDAAGAAAQTNNPDAARRGLEQARKTLAPTASHAALGQVTENEQGASAKVDLSWDFGEGKVWRYTSTVQLVDESEGWKVLWAPSVLHPDLKPGQTLAYSEVLPAPGAVTGSEGRQLMGPEPVVTVSLNGQEAGDVPGVAGKLAQALSPIEPAITQQSIVEGVGKTPPGQPYQVVTLRQADYDKVRASIYDLPGVRFPAQMRLLAAERGYASQVLAGVSKKVDEQVKANAGWQVAITDDKGTEVRKLHTVAEKPVPPTSVTLSDRTQRAAEKALDPIPQAAMIVAMKPSNGEVLAVAQNDPADAQGPMALSGQYPPGSTFKMVTGAAALESGKVRADTPVECPAKKVFDGMTLPNDKEFDLGRVPLHTAFAQSCNTTFAQLSVDLPDDALPKEAKKFGLGVDFDMPGATTITGKVTNAETVTQHAANGIGQGKVLASPFGMALAAASVANGGMPTPTLMRGQETKADATPEKVSPAALDQLRSMMREVVTGGTARGLAGSGEVRGKTGTAQFGDGTHSHGWFVGYRDDVAFAVLITDAGASGPSVDAAKRFLGGL